MLSKTAKWLAPLCLALAMGLFLWPRPSPTEADLFVTLEITALAPGMALDEAPLRGVEIRIRGPEKLVREQLDKAHVYRLDLSGMQAGIQSVPVRPERFGLPREIQVLHAHPDPLIFRIEHETSREVPVSVTLSGAPSGGFYVAEARPLPASVRLKGPESCLAPVTAVKTKPVDVSGLQESIRREVPLDLSEGVATAEDRGTVLVELTIGEKEAVRTFNGVPVNGRNARYRFIVTPPQIDIEVKAPVNTLKKLENNGIDTYVDLQGLSPGVYPRRAVIALPVGATLLQAKPEIFTVTIQPQAVPKTTGPTDTKS